jgi:hypothetical protein
MLIKKQKCHLCHGQVLTGRGHEKSFNNDEMNEKTPLVSIQGQYFANPFGE